MSHFALRGTKGRFVLAEAGIQNQGLFGAQASAEGENKLRRPVAAKDFFLADSFKFTDGCHQLPAVGVRIVAQVGNAVYYRLLHRLRSAVGIDVCGKIQANFSGIKVPTVGIWGGIEHCITSKAESDR